MTFKNVIKKIRKELKSKDSISVSVEMWSHDIDRNTELTFSVYVSDHRLFGEGSSLLSAYKDLVQQLKLNKSNNNKKPSNEDLDENKL